MSLLERYDWGLRKGGQEEKGKEPSKSKDNRFVLPAKNLVQKIRRRGRKEPSLS